MSMTKSQVLPFVMVPPGTPTPPNTSWATLKTYPRRPGQPLRGTQHVPQLNKWRSSIMFEGREMELGLHDTEDQAAAMHDMKAVSLYGAMSPVNFPYAGLIETGTMRVLRMRMSNGVEYAVPDLYKDRNQALGSGPGRPGIVPPGRLRVPQGDPVVGAGPGSGVTGMGAGSGGRQIGSGVGQGRTPHVSPRAGWGATGGVPQASGGGQGEKSGGSSSHSHQVWNPFDRGGTRSRGKKKKRKIQGTPTLVALFHLGGPWCGTKRIAERDRGAVSSTWSILLQTGSACFV
ncbi:unnamed protein product [Discosporangium mesarthrocarpum]